jgi:hypothetical protein
VTAKSRTKEKTEKKTKKTGAGGASKGPSKKSAKVPEAQWPEGFDPKAMFTDTSAETGKAKSRLDVIRESHALLKQFDSKELKTLMNLKRNTSPKAWSLREDLVVLTLPMSNREIADMLTGRNKEAVKKRLQLLRSKGLTKRTPPEIVPKKK